MSASCYTNVVIRNTTVAKIWGGLREGCSLCEETDPLHLIHSEL